MFVAGWMARSLGARISDRRGGLSADALVAALFAWSLWIGMTGRWLW
jgi:hypothetical protein